tara:strand:- start:1455 stop:1673 length:219 start_codon:yes stop_codon:yes gene_type:complete
MTEFGNYMAAASLDLNEAWNLSWGEGIQFILVLAFVYWLKVKIDTRAGLGKKKLRQLKTVIKEAIQESKGVS